MILNEVDYILIPGIFWSRIITGVGSFDGGICFDDSSGMTFLSGVTVLLTKLYSQCLCCQNSAKDLSEIYKAERRSSCSENAIFSCALMHVMTENLFASVK